MLHVALRNRSNTPIVVDGKDVMPEVNAVLAKMRDFTERLRDGRWKGHTGKTITDVVNIGIGGSDLGPVMATEALRPYWKDGMTVHFVSNIDGTHVVETLEATSIPSGRCSSWRARRSRRRRRSRTRRPRAHGSWDISQESGCRRRRRRLRGALSTNAKEVSAFGIDTANMFEFWDWVGGRYSLWSAIGLSIACVIGMDNFEQMLAGGHAMDEHFRILAPLAENLPVLLGLIGIWYNNFFGAETHAIPAVRSVPPDRFAAYFQQGDMESNGGKGVDRAGHRITDYTTGPIILGRARHERPACLLPADPPGNPGHPGGLHRADRDPQPERQAPRDLALELLRADRGADEGQDHRRGARGARQREGALGQDRRARPAQDVHRQSPDDVDRRPEDRRRTPLGTLIALYEHKIFVQGIVWNINSFDQWGVELGKQLAQKIQPELEGQGDVSSHDSSTNGLINLYKSRRKH